MSRKARRYAELAAVLGTVIWSTLAYADFPIQAGNVVALKGRSTVTRAATPQPAEVPLRYRDDLFHEDRIRTMQLSLVKYLLATKGVVTVGENSTVIVRVPPGGGPTIVDLKNGKVALTVAPDSGGVEVKAGGGTITAVGGATAARFGVSMDRSGDMDIINTSGSPKLNITLDQKTLYELPGGQGLSIIGMDVKQFTVSGLQEKAFFENFKTSPSHGMLKGVEDAVVRKQLRIAVGLADAVCRGIEGCPGRVEALSDSRALIYPNTISPPYITLDEPGARPPDNSPPSTPSQPDVTITGTTVTPLDAFPHTSAGGEIRAVGPNQTVKSFDGTTNRQSTGPVVQMSNVSQIAGLQDVVRVNPSARLDVVAPLVSAESSRVDPVGRILAIGAKGDIHSTSATPLLNFNSSLVRATSFATLDQALLEATAPLLNLIGSGATLTGGTGSSTSTPPGNALDLTNSSTLHAKLNALSDAVIKLDSSALNVLQGALLAMSASTVQIDNGMLVNLSNKSNLMTSANLLSLTNGSTINLLNGALVRVSGGSTLDVAGALVSFGNTGNNSLTITNNMGTITPITFGSGSNIVNLPVALLNGATAADIQRKSGLPFVNLAPSPAQLAAGQKNTVTITPGSAVIVVDGIGNKVLLGP